MGAGNLLTAIHLSATGSSELDSMSPSDPNLRAPILEERVCPTCGAKHKVHWHQVSVHNRDKLPCPSCGKVLVSWDGPVFSTLATTPPTIPTPQQPNQSESSATQQTWI